MANPLKPLLGIIVLSIMLTVVAILLGITAAIGVETYEMMRAVLG